MMGMKSGWVFAKSFNLPQKSIACACAGPPEAHAVINWFTWANWPLTMEVWRNRKMFTQKLKMKISSSEQERMVRSDCTSLRSSSTLEPPVKSRLVFSVSLINLFGRFRRGGQGLAAGDALHDAGDVRVLGALGVLYRLVQQLLHHRLGGAGFRHCRFSLQALNPVDRV